MSAAENESSYVRPDASADARAPPSAYGIYRLSLPCRPCVVSPRVSHHRNGAFVGGRTAQCTDDADAEACRGSAGEWRPGTRTEP